MNATVLSRIRDLLVQEGASFIEKEHPPTRTSEESAAARGEELGVGAKALLLRIDGIFRLFILPADRKLNSAAIKEHFQVKKTRFATPEELFELTGLVPGAVPPFGPPILPFELYADDEVGALQGRVAFNAGSLTHSVILSATDWERVAKPQRMKLTLDP